MNFLRISEIKSIPKKEEGGHGFYWAATGLLPGLSYTKRKGRPACLSAQLQGRERGPAQGHWADVAAIAVGPREKRGSRCWALGQLALVLSRKPLSKAGSGTRAARDARVHGDGAARDVLRGLG